MDMLIFRFTAKQHYRKTVSRHSL